MNNYNKNTEHESIDLAICRDFDYFIPDDYDYIYDDDNIYQNDIIKSKWIENPLDKKKLLREKKEVLIELADFLVNNYDYYTDFVYYTKEELADYIIENFFGGTLKTHILVNDFNIEKYFLKGFKLYKVYGYCQGDLTYFIDLKGLDENELTNMLYNAPLSIRLKIDNEEYFVDNIIDYTCYDIDKLKKETINFLKNKKYSQYVIDFVDNNFKEDNY